MANISYEYEFSILLIALTIKNKKNIIFSIKISKKNGSFGFKFKNDLFWIRL